MGVVSWGLYHESEKLKKEEYENLIELEFCGKMFKSLPSWDKYLSNLYGNYMELPKEENRKIHDIDAWLVD
ncbi:hypothetical protein IR145_12610 [Streptococcus danieliae]|nr:hypothetical protein [Streptococcus danieliae]